MGFMKSVEGEHQEEIRDWLQAVELHACPVCGSDKGIQAGDVCTIPMTGGPNQKPTVLAIPITCLACGYLFFLNSRYLFFLNSIKHLG